VLSDLLVLASQATVLSQLTQQAITPIKATDTPFFGASEHSSVLHPGAKFRLFEKENELNALRYVRMVLWSFLGIRRRAGADEEIATVSPLILILVAIAIAACFGALLVALAVFAAGRGA
jgi:hypothetical protein